MRAEPFSCRQSRELGDPGPPFLFEEFRAGREQVNIPTFGRLKQEDDCEFKTQLGYIAPGEPKKEKQKRLPIPSTGR